MNSNVSLVSMFEPYDWFHSVGSDSYNRPVVYVNYFNADVFRMTAPIPGNVKVHSAGSVLARRSDYVRTESLSTVDHEVEASSDEDELDFDVHQELWNLQQICGRENLIDTFYELVDKDDAVTFVSQEYPDVRAAMEKLYDTFGFDVLYEELDGEDSLIIE